MLRAQELRSAGKNEDEIASELVWEEKLHQAYAVQLTKSLRSEDTDGTNRRENEVRQSLARERDGLKNQLEAMQRTLAELQAELESHKVSGKSRQTYLKLIYLVARDRGFDPSQNSSAVSDLLSELADADIAAEDDEAIRNALKDSVERKLGGYWMPKKLKQRRS